MNKLWLILKDHIRKDFDPLLYGLIVLFLVMSISLNYLFKIDNNFFDKYNGKSIQIFFYFLLCSFAYYGSSFITLTVKGKANLFQKKEYWTLTLAGLLILSFRVGFPFLSELTQYFISDSRIFLWAYYCLANLIDLATTAFPLVLLLILLQDKKERFGVNSLYEMNGYWLILFCIIPVIFVGSFEKGFSNYYPTYKPNSVAEILKWPFFLPMIIYESCYALDFFNVEFLFRGFMVIGLTRILGKEAILPMVVTYCFLHFGKPIGEAISSIFGGYILGVFAFYTRNIWGGVILHIGVAWTMEIAAYLQKMLN